MYLKPLDHIKVINSMREIERIRKEKERITLEEWSFSIIGSGCLIGILFIINYQIGA